MRIPSPLLVVLAALAPAVPVHAADDPFAALDLEAHGFASFGHLTSWGNNWLGDTKDGTGDFWEAAANVVARPMDRLRIGVQLFARDLGRYDNGKVTLDWAYADWRAIDELGVQVGRVKIPVGLYNEVLDVDAARTPVFLPTTVYSLRTRDLYVSTDGAKVYGSVSHGGGAGVDYQLFVGDKEFDPAMGFGTYFLEQGLGTRTESIDVELLYGGMLHWRTPVQGLAFRATVGNANSFEAVGEDEMLGIMSTLSVDDYMVCVVSTLYEVEDWTFAAEYTRNYARGQIAVEPLGIAQAYRDDADGGYISATWHARPWLELYGALEGDWSDATDRSATHVHRGVIAVNLMPLANWSLKAEFRQNQGSYGISAFDEPDGAEESWQVLALKTTVDF